jgi:microcystin-dependent protein
MSEPFIAEIRIFAGTFAPRNFAFCDGQLLPIAQNTALFALVGTTYGGDGRTTLGLPDLKGRAPMHAGRGPGLSPRTLGQKTGGEQVTLGQQNMPNHTHTVTHRAVSALGSQTSPVGAALAQSPSGRGGFGLYDDTDNQGDMATTTLANAGGGAAHDNMQPYLVLNFIIALVGFFPSRN